MGTYTNFIESIKGYAIDLYNEYGILPSITISQAVLESGGGTSGLASGANNLFGIKGTGSAGSVSMKTKEYNNGAFYSTNANFASYSSVADSIAAYGALIGTKERYSGVRAADNYSDALTALGSSGYATDPTYTTKLKSIIEDNNLALYDNVAISGSTNKGVIGGFDLGDIMGLDSSAGSSSDVVSQIFSGIGSFFQNTIVFVIGGAAIALGIYFLFGQDMNFTISTGGAEQ